MDLLLTAREVSAQEAKEIGLIGRVVPDGTALEAALEIAEVIAANGPLAVEAIKASVKATEGIPEEEALKIELEIGWPIFATEDAKEGQRAFAEKRPPSLPAPVSDPVADDAGMSTGPAPPSGRRRCAPLSP